MKETLPGSHQNFGRAELDFEEISELYRPKIFRLALASLRDRDAAETIAQDCLLRAADNWNSFRHECSVQTWLMQIAVNLIRDHQRNRRTRFWKSTMLQSRTESWANAVSSCISPELAASLKQQVEAVWSVVDKLPERQKTVFLLRFMEGLDITEIATVAGLKEGTVKSHLFRAIASVRERLAARS